MFEAGPDAAEAGLLLRLIVLLVDAVLVLVLVLGQLCQLRSIPDPEAVPDPNSELNEKKKDQARARGGLRVHCRTAGSGEMRQVSHSISLFLRLLMRSYSLTFSLFSLRLLFLADGISHAPVRSFFHVLCAGE